jgi:hypothetical protein
VSGGGHRWFNRSTGRKKPVTIIIINMIKKEAENIFKYKDLTTKIHRMCYVRARAINFYCEVLIFENILSFFLDHIYYYYYYYYYYYCHRLFLTGTSVKPAVTPTT